MNTAPSEKAAVSPTGSFDVPAAHDPERAAEYDDELPVPCPPHTTERKLIAKIDMHVVPFLCIMYLLAFLGKQGFRFL